MLEKQKKRERRHRRIRAKIKGTAKIPRLCVFRSAKHIYAYLIDDENGKVILGVNDCKIKLGKEKILAEEKAVSSLSKKETGEKKKEIDAKNVGKEKILGRKSALAYKVGGLLAKKALERKIKKIVFDRGGYKYHGRVKALAEGARKAGLEF